MFPATGVSPSVLRLNGAGYVATVADVTDFPSTVFSVGLWIRATSSSGGDGGGVVLSYAAPDSSVGDFEILVHDLRGLRLLVHAKYVTAFQRYDGPSGGDLAGIRTGINVARDGAWHHVAVAWRSADGKVDAYLDGARVFDGGPYKSGAELSAGGKLVLGQPSASACVLSNSAFDSVGELTTESTGCDPPLRNSGPGGLEADVQHLRVWSKYVTADEVAQQMQEPFEGNSIGQVKLSSSPLSTQFDIT